ncbi:MAG: PAS domain S-box protein [Candidatus Abyssobacteria bacterium SURF_5]|uniref:histidine kinase n=1 Tax=Abyssobacteria bacterium (strain SURF_5) TaxID=2093360 RepID=A0A3A4NRS5_ABYX5|nr:MAG: PAS domain S-box protein [Candidatus Abyssubacteria bacterium SURF_5]
MAQSNKTRVELLEEVKTLRDRLEEEERARVRLEEMIKEFTAAAKATLPHGIEETEEEPAESIRKLLLILERTPDMISYATPDGKVKYMNRAGRLAVGIPLDIDFVGCSIADGHPGWANKILTEVAIPTAIREGMWLGETAVLTHDGVEIPVSQLILAHKGPAGEIQYLSTICRDISERKKGEELLRHGLTEIESIYNSAPVGLCFFDRELRYVRVNERLAEINGIPPSEHIGKTPREIVPDLAPLAERIAEEIFRTGMPILDIQFSGTTRSQPGVQRYWKEQWLPLKDASERVFGINVVVEEITERKRAEEALRQSESRYRTLFESIDEGFCIIEMIFDASGKPTDWRFLEANPAFEKHNGLHNAVGKRMRELEPRLEEHWFETYGRIALTGKPERFTNEAKHLDNRWFDLYAFRVGRPEERKVAVLFKNITERKRAEAALQEAHKKLQVTIDSITDGLMVLDRTWNVTYFSETGAKMLGMRREGLIGGYVWDLFPYARERKFYGEYNRSVETGQPAHFVEFYPDPINKWIECHAYPSEEGLTVYFRDITARKEAEEKIARQSAVLDGINRILQETLRSETEEDVARVCLEVAEKLTESAFGFIGEINREGTFHTIVMSDLGWAECKMPDSNKTPMIRGLKMRCYWGKALVDNQSLIVNDPANHPDRVGVPEGHPAITSFMAVPLKRDGKTIGMISLANRAGGYTVEHQQDVEALSITFVEALERKRADEALRESEARFRDLSQKLEETVKQKTSELLQAEHLAAVGQMVSTVAHEIRNPIQIIRTGVDTLREARDGTERQDLLSEIEYGAKMLEITISEILEYSKPLKLKFSHTTVKNVVEATVKLVSNELKNITTNVDLQRDDEEICVDVVKFSQVLVNIISNAADAMPHGGTVSIHSRSLDRADGKFLEISVADTGHGIEEKHIRDIFKPFFTTKTRGTGLGLSLCRKIMDAHKGSMSIKSKVGEGTTVTLVLPLE